MIGEALIVGQQVLMIFIFIFLGIFCVKKNIFTKETGRALSSFSLSVIMPCILINSYQRPLEKEMLGKIGFSFLLAVVCHAVFAVIAIVFIKKRGDIRYRIERLAVMFSNCGYMAIPLIQATIGDEGVVYSAAFIAVFNVLLWSAGVAALEPGKKPSIRKLLFTPGMAGLAIGFSLYLFQVTLPAPLRSAVFYIAETNTPVAMMTIGIFLTGINVKSTFTDKNVYKASFLRLIAAPLLVLLIYRIAGAAHWFEGSDKVVMANMLAAACPSAAAATLFPARMGMDGEYGARIIAVSTLLSLITLPVMNYLTNLVL